VKSRSNPFLEPTSA